MDNAAFERVRSEIMGGFPPSGGDDLLGMVIDFNAYLYGLDGLDAAQARRTDDPERLIVAVASAKPGASASDVSTALQQVWIEALRYNYREGHVVTSNPESVLLRAIAQISPDGFYVTAEVTVSLRG